MVVGLVDLCFVGGWLLLLCGFEGVGVGVDGIEVGDIEVWDDWFGGCGVLLGLGGESGID